jgi:hypothetical protein
MSWVAGPQRFLIVLLVLGCLGGCKSLFGTPGPPEDPLFVSRRPLDAKAERGSPVILAYSEPAPPANPFLASRGVSAAHPASSSQSSQD